MRLHLAEEPRKESPEDIKQALHDWRRLNSSPRTWATFEALQFANERVVRVNTGTIHTDGTKEIAIATFTYMLKKDGSVSVVKSTHL